MPLSMGTMRRAGFAGGDGFLDFGAELSPLTRTRESPLGRRHQPGCGLMSHLDPAQGSTGTGAVLEGEKVGSA